MSDLPNIFRYATKELSQDAVICWLAEWANRSDSHPMTRCGKDFVALLYNTATGGTAVPEDVKAVSVIDRQFKNMDIYFICFTLRVFNDVKEMA